MKFDPTEHVVDRALNSPIGFSQVREDALLDLEVVERVGRADVRVIMIASGGCTAAALAACGKVSQIQLVDLNASQMALALMKLHLLEHYEPGQRMQILGHEEMAEGERLSVMREILSRLDLRGTHALGDPESVARLGADCCGRYEILFKALWYELLDWIKEVRAVLEMEDAKERAERVAPGTQLGRAMDEAFDRVMSLENLVKLFGEGATGNARQPFSRHFAERTRWAIANLSTKDNPYLWQMLMRGFPQGVVYPWLSAARQRKMPEVGRFFGPMDQALQRCGGGFDFVHLSNILDWLSKEEARKMLELAWSALEPGGYVLIRQLNSTLDIRWLGEKFDWLIDESEEMHKRDRSFFYRQLHLGRRL